MTSQDHSVPSVRKTRTTRSVSSMTQTVDHSVCPDGFTAFGKTSIQAVSPLDVIY